jgi:predicted ATPase
VPIYGREQELDQLRQAWLAVRGGSGKPGRIGLVVIHGEPGIGKTCLATAFREQLGREEDGQGARVSGS